MNGWKDRLTLIRRTLPATSGVPKDTITYERLPLQLISTSRNNTIQKHVFLFIFFLSYVNSLENLDIDRTKLPEMS